MASISSPGIGSGLDVNTIVSQMMAVEKRPLQLLQTNASSIDTKISSYGQIKSALSALYDAANGLMSSSVWQSKQFATTDKDAVTGSVSTAAVAGNFSLQVTALASSQSLASGSFASGAVMGSAGTLSLQTGRWDAAGTGFTGAGAKVDISIAATDTLADVASKINGANAGVSAVVVKGSNGDQLLVRGTKTGQENGFSMSVLDDGTPPAAPAPGSALNKLVYDQASVSAAQAGMSRTVAASDATFTINGIEATSATNTVADVVPGVTLNLLKTSTTPVEVTVSADKKAVRDKVEAFQQAYNKINTLLADLTRYDQSSKTAQPLQGDSTATGLQNALRGLLGRPNATGTYFTNVGLELQRDGSLNINATKLDAALNDLPKLEKTLTASTGNPGTDGLVTRMRDFVFGANGVDGNITGRSKALEAAKKRNQSDQDAMSLRLEQRQQNMLKQYQALDTKLGSMSSLNSFMTSQISQWNKS
ncbi:hypothetical protein DTW89_07400 [Acidovorax sp. BoFeN1]|uniref:flagellar filament capping protein FliD n=1 Tax=Acidovorax sp. BoFeN1 TaxID=1231053 RepID=UPI000E09D497|nr:flagellar filament capping protein FliD [Acidovorax sp. BoFeN1]RDD93898.1 hypothetical protein DTW89_07400 [Acidovorax sp. BoFeN1]